MAENTPAPLPATTSFVISTGTLDAESKPTRPLIGLLAASAFVVAACILLGVAPASWVPLSFIGVPLAAAWCTGIVAFACSVGSDSRVTLAAIEHRRLSQEQGRAWRNAA